MLCATIEITNATKQVLTALRIIFLYLWSFLLLGSKNWVVAGRIFEIMGI